LAERAAALAVFGGAGIAIGIWAFVELGCLRGTVGYNQYGADPLTAPPPATPSARRGPGRECLLLIGIGRAVVEFQGLTRAVRYPMFRS
jgi:hypothetical protein